MPRTVPRLALALATVLAGCARPGTPATTPAPRTAPRTTDSTAHARPHATAKRATARAGALPPIPVVAGSLSVHVVYPASTQLITSRDSTFVLGSLGNGNATLTIDGQPARVYPNGAFMAFVANPPATAPHYDLVAVLGVDTLRTTYPVRVRAPVARRPEAPAPPPPPDTVGKWVRLDDPAAATLPDTDQTIVVRPRPNDTYHWFFLPGTVVWRDRSENGYTRIRVDSELAAWVPDSVTHNVDPEAPPPRRVADNAVVRSAPGWEDFVLPVGSRPAYFVEERDHAIDLTLYDTRGNTDIVRYPTGDSLIRRVEWAQVDDDRVRYTLHLSAQPYGYLVLWEHGQFVLRVRRPPAIDRAHPLRGLVIAIDAGHPPGGATGPTDLREPDAVLAVSERLKTMLEAEGAAVVMTRSDSEPVGLDDRAVIARRADADAFVSVHLNSFPDGTNPFTTAEGSATFFYRGQSEPLARAVQRGMVASMGLPDQGVVFRSLAVVRQTWMPSILCEGAFVIVPEQEAALRTPQFQTAYARGIADGLRAYFAALGAGR
ncbi:MAG TPA: N-acetylmuramoyl-L-alanine amidase [Gemmatimonadaceae bacterium]|nr:N-acetylmuramoyl-L-alanine amidase [Gemmatimonadaceae bacterium]